MSPVRLAPGAMVGPWMLEVRLGRGAHGEVWRARHPELGVLVALKVGTRSRTGSLDHELSAIRRLRHPAVLPVLDHGEDGGHAWLALELAVGSLADGPPPPGERRALVARLLGGLAHA